jgi:2-amino-4-hydroxy-6-hydroxymethyldihydropteridine diphosphokinase
LGARHLPAAAGDAYRADAWRRKADLPECAVKNVNKIALIALGANLPLGQGSPLDTLRAALANLAARGARPVARSGWWSTPAYPAGSGPDFVNAAAALETALDPAALLATLHAVERGLGRERRRRWAPRACDLDLLAMEDLVLPDAETSARWRDLDPAAQALAAPEGLVLPHPRLQDRAFVLAPLAEVAPDWLHPALGLTVREMRDALPPDAFDGMARFAGPDPN